MKKLVKWFFGLIGILIVLVILITGAFFLWFDPNDHKEFISARVTEATGRTFFLKGDIALSYYPWLEMLPVSGMFRLCMQKVYR